MMILKCKTFLLVFVLIIISASCTDFREEALGNRTKYANETSISLNTDIEILSGRLSFIDSGTSNSRSEIVAYSVPEIPENAYRLANAPTNYNEGVMLTKDNAYYVAEGEKFSGTISGSSVDNVDIYVAGKLDITAWWIDGGNVNIYILPSGTLNYASDTYNKMAIIRTGVNVYCWGAFSTLHEGGGIRISEGAALSIYKTKNARNFYLNPQGGMWDCSFWVEGKFTSDRPVIIDGNLLVNGGTAVFNSELTVVNELYIQSGSLDLNGCSTIEQDLKFSGNGTLWVGKYLNVNNLETCNGIINMGDASLVRVEQNLFLTASNNTHIFAGKKKYAVIEATCIFSETKDLSQFMHGYIDIQSNEIRQGNRWWYSDYIDLNTSNTAGVIINGNTKIEINGCSDEGNPSGDSGKTRLVEIATLVPPANYYSATGIAFNGNLAYVSWHINPKHNSEKYGGAIDVINVTARQVLQNRLNSDIKYNHIMFNDDWLYSAGDDYKWGAILSKIHLENGKFSDDKKEQLVTLTGNSGSCVELVGNTLITASGTDNGGFDLLLPASSEKQVSLFASDAKFVYSDGKRIVTLNDMSLGTINVYQASQGWHDDMLDTPILTFNAGPIFPENGKNVVMCDDKFIYVCMGDNGLRSFDVNTGKEVAYYNITKVNGIDVDEKYIYIANGYGITVLQIDGLSYVASYTDYSGSANYVKKGEDGYIYVAYGISGFRIFKMEKYYD